MVKFFSVDWLAQSHHSTPDTEERGVSPDTAAACKPHVPCMVQPRPPTYGKGYLQPKPRAPKAVEHPELVESSPCSLSHPAICASPISELSGDSSGYESEAASSECLSVDDGSELDKDAPQRRVRTKFTPEQISKLEKIFAKHKYLDSGKRVKTAQKLHLTETQVRTWFQNRRMKLKREVQDYLPPQVSPVVFQRLPPVHYHSVAARQGAFPASSPAFYPLPGPQMVLQQQMPAHPPHLMMQSRHFY